MWLATVARCTQASKRCAMRGSDAGVAVQRPQVAEAEAHMTLKPVDRARDVHRGGGGQLRGRRAATPPRSRNETESDVVAMLPHRPGDGCGRGMPDHSRKPLRWERGGTLGWGTCDEPQEPPSLRPPGSCALSHTHRSTRPHPPHTHPWPSHRPRRPGRAGLGCARWLDCWGIDCWPLRW